MKKTVAPELLSTIEDIITSCGVELYDVELKGKTLRVLINKPDGISLDNCVNVSESLSTKFDVKNLIPSQYYLEISSPGIERKLRNKKDFEQIIGHTISVSTHFGHYIGELISVTETGINIKNRAGSNGKSGSEQTILFRDINHARRIISDEELFDKINYSNKDKYKDKKKLRRNC